MEIEAEARVRVEKIVARYNGDLATFRANSPFVIPALAAVTLGALTAALGGGGWTVMAALLCTFTGLVCALLFEQRLCSAECIYWATTVAALAASFHPSERELELPEQVRWQELLVLDEADMQAKLVTSADTQERMRRMIVRAIFRHTVGTVSRK